MKTVYIVFACFVLALVLSLPVSGAGKKLGQLTRTNEVVVVEDVDAPNGVAGLDANGHIVTNAIPEIIVIFSGSER